MKSLNVEQMESINAGIDWCGFFCVLIGAAVGGVAGAAAGAAAAGAICPKDSTCP